MCQVDCAIELHLYAGRPRAALALITQRLSDALPGSLTNTAKGAPTVDNAIEHAFEVCMQAVMGWSRE